MSVLGRLAATVLVSLWLLTLLRLQHMYAWLPLPAFCSLTEIIVGRKHISLLEGAQGLLLPRWLECVQAAADVSFREVGLFRRQVGFCQLTSHLLWAGHEASVWCGANQGSQNNLSPCNECPPCKVLVAEREMRDSRSDLLGFLFTPNHLLFLRAQEGGSTSWQAALYSARMPEMPVLC